MKTNLLITSLSLIATSAYAQPSVPSVGLPPPTVRAEMPGQGVPSMPQPAMPRPAPQMNQSGPQPAVGAAGGNGGNGGLLVGNGGSGATPLPPTMHRGVGPTPLKNDDVGQSGGGTPPVRPPPPRQPPAPPPPQPPAPAPPPIPPSLVK